MGMMFEKTNRILHIFYCVVHGEEVSIQRLADHYHVSTKTISRDLSIIKDFLAENRELTGNAELCYSRKRKTHHLEWLNHTSAPGVICKTTHGSNGSKSQVISNQSRNMEEQQGEQLDISLFCKEEVIQMVLEYFPMAKGSVSNLPVGESRILEISAAMRKELIRTLLSFGSQVKVLEPEMLAKEMQAEVAQMEKLYQS